MPHRGHYQSLADLGVDRHDADAIAQLYLSDIGHVVSVHFPLLCKGAIDRHLLHRLLARVQQLREIQSVRDELLHSGRPTEPTEAEEISVWQVLAAWNKPNDTSLTILDYLTLCKSTGLSARTVWMVIQRRQAEEASAVAIPLASRARQQRRS